MTEQTIRTINEKPNSFVFRYGKTGTDVKLYYEDSSDLLQQLTEFADSAIKYKELITTIQNAMKEE